MGTEIIPFDKKKRDIDKAGLRDRGENPLARKPDTTSGNDFIRAAVEIRRLSRKRNEISANLAQRNEKESTYIAPQVKQPDKLFSSDDEGVIFDRRPEIFQETSLDLAPLEFDKQKALQSNVIAFTPTPLESFDVKPLPFSSSFNPLESRGLENDFLASIDFPVDIGVNNALEPISLNVDDSELLVESLGKRLALHQESSLAPQTFKVDLVHNEQSFKISPLEVEPMDIEDVIEAPLEVQVNMLVKGAALLEKRKHDPPPLLRREGRALEREKGQILRALDEIIDRGTMRAGELIAGRWGKRGLSFAGMTGLALASSACAGRSVPIPLNTLVPTISAEPIVPADLPKPTAEQLPTPVRASIASLYPTTDEGFMLGAGGLENAEERIRELGAGGDIEKMKGMLIAEMNRTGINPETIEWDFSINEQADNPSWTMWPKDRVSGHYLLPKLTTGSDEGQLIRSGNLFAYLDREIGDDFFDLVELKNLQGSLGVEQRIVPDDSGWFVPGGFATDGEILEWFSVDRDEWVGVRKAGELGLDLQFEVELDNLRTSLSQNGLETELTQLGNGDYAFSHIDRGNSTEIGVITNQSGQNLFELTKENGKPAYFSIDQAQVDPESGFLTFDGNDGEVNFVYVSQIHELRQVRDFPYLSEMAGRLTMNIGESFDRKDGYGFRRLTVDNRLPLREFLDPGTGETLNLNSQERLSLATEVAQVLIAQAWDSNYNFSDLREGKTHQIRTMDGEMLTVDPTKGLNFYLTSTQPEGGYFKERMGNDIEHWWDVDSEGALSIYVSIDPTDEHVGNGYNLDFHYRQSLLSTMLLQYDESAFYLGYEPYSRLPQSSWGKVGLLIGLVSEIDQDKLQNLPSEVSYYGSDLMKELAIDHNIHLLYASR